jgi:hypothetical protein
MTTATSSAADLLLTVPGRMLTAILDAIRNDDEMRAERDRAADRSRSHTRSRVEAPPDPRPLFRAKRPS